MAADKGQPRRSIDLMLPARMKCTDIFAVDDTFTGEKVYQ